MPRHELLAKIRRWVGRLSDAQLAALEADIKESVPGICDPRYDAVVDRVRGMLGGDENAEGVVRLLREKGCMKNVLR
jgi:hypothetical protein